MEKIYNENELNFLLSKKGSQNLVVKADCRICGLEFEARLKRLKTGFLCRKCKISETKKNITEEEKQKINEKRIETCKEKYGVENVFQLNEVKEKSKETLEKEYGVSNPRFLQLDSNYVKKTNERKQKEIEEVSKEKLDENLEKLSNLKLTKWDEWTPEDVNAITEKRKATCKEIYGVEFSMQSEEVKKHYKENSLKNWGFEMPQQNPKVKVGVNYWKCPICSSEHDRDINAALNILSKYVTSQSIVGRGPSEITNADGEPRSSMKSESPKALLETT